MIQDKSENFKDTIQFLDNRLNDLANFNFASNEVSFEISSLSISELF